MAVSSLDTKKPKFGFGASLSAMHSNGGLVRAAKSHSRPNKIKTLAAQLEAESMSESEDSAANSSSSSQDGHGNLSQSSLLNHAAKKSSPANKTVHVGLGSDSCSDSDSASDDPTSKNKYSDLLARKELLAKLNGLKGAQHV